MKKFFIIISSIFLTSIVSLYIIQFTVFEKNWFKNLTGYFGIELYEALKIASSVNSHGEKLILGDSAGNQLISHGVYESDHMISLACNQATTMVGQYILLNTFFENNPHHNIDEVILIYHPSSFENNMDLKYTYQYLLKPFYRDPYKEYFNENAQQLVKKIPFYQFCQFPLIKMTKWSPRYDYKDDLDYFKFRLSQLSIDYLRLINKLCIENNCVFQILPPVMKEKYRNEWYLRDMKEQIQDAGLMQLFQDYFKCMIFEKDNIFKDMVHLSPEFIPIIQRRYNYPVKALSK